ncbi:MAG: PAAR domain-containing protein [Planctomycetes bacterium]|nr:PAAR domain-containing protein [Planctomycetota bacterium]
MPNLARVGDLHLCPVCGATGPITGPGVPTVLIGGQPAAVAGDACFCPAGPDALLPGNPNILIGHKPVVRMGDPTGHGGVVVGGDPTVQIG